MLNLWAGVEDVTGNSTLKMPLARMVDHGLTRGMVEWVVGHTLRHHLGMDVHLNGQDGMWRKAIQPWLKTAACAFGAWGLGHGLRRGAVGAWISNARL